MHQSFGEAENHRMSVGQKTNKTNPNQRLILIVFKVNH